MLDAVACPLQVNGRCSPSSVALLAQFSDSFGTGGWGRSDPIHGKGSLMRRSSSRRWLDPIRAALGIALQKQNSRRRLQLLHLEDRALPSSNHALSFTTIDRGDYYSVPSKGKVQLLERVGEYAVRLTPGTDAES